MDPVRIEEKPALRLIGLRCRFRNGRLPDSNAGEVVGPTWGALHPRLAEIDATDRSVLYGYTWFAADDPEECEYIAGAPVGPDAEVPDGMEAVETAASTYAVFEHHGHMMGFGDTIRAIYDEWLPNSDYVGNGEGDVELYDERWNMEGEGSVMEYWVGIKPKS